MNFKFISSVILFFTFAAGGNSAAQNGELTLKIVPEKSDLTYEINQPAKFVISAQIGNRAAAGQAISYKCRPEFMPPITEKEVSIIGNLTIEAGTMKEPGFLRCIVSAVKDGKTYCALATAGYELVHPEILFSVTSFSITLDSKSSSGRRKRNRAGF